MGISVAFHNLVDECNIVKGPARAMGEFLQRHPLAHKVALAVDHVYRSAPMAALVLLFPTPLNIGLCFTGALFYRLTAERTCTYNFTLPAFATSVACLIGKTALGDLISGVAFTSLNTLAATALPLIPLAACVTYVALSIAYDVDHRP